MDVLYRNIDSVGSPRQKVFRMYFGVAIEKGENNILIACVRYSERKLIAPINGPH